MLFSDLIKAQPFIQLLVCVSPLVGTLSSVQFPPCLISSFLVPSMDFLRTLCASILAQSFVNSPFLTITPDYSHLAYNTCMV